MYSNTECIASTHSLSGLWDADETAAYNRPPASSQNRLLSSAGELNTAVELGAGDVTDNADDAQADAQV